MATEITMPQLGESVTEGTITRWLVKPGDYVNKYDPIAEVMTDKVNAEVPSSYAGTVEALKAEEDDTVAVGDIIMTMILESEGSEAEEAQTVPLDQAEKTGGQTGGETAGEPTDTHSEKTRYSPAVLKLAQEHSLNLADISGSGRGGRITRKDVQSVIAGGHKSSGAETKQKNAAVNNEHAFAAEPAETSVSSDSGRYEEIPVSGVRKAIADNMVQAKHDAPHAWMMIEADVTDLVRYREKMKADFFEKEGIKLTFLPFFMKAVVEALKAYPEVNARWGGDRIYRYKDVHLSMAVATENELFVPVIKNAEEKSVRGLARAMNRLTADVQHNRLKQEDMQGGTFTLNNTGSFGSVQSQPIINTPQAAILSVESIVKRPVVMDEDAIAVRHMVNLCMSLDHRVLDGLISGKFMNHIKQTLENMNDDTLSL
ncbi:dihydrolipoamide acetyltransferase family protein [Salisediminibacterium halotolerans]|uniref:Dihydrolipoamide acetyltransferase component of pyruvate dehydrogenase complex n=1 Tax=Salisediminibacterium halotolerans TaxID=517425 RepID=A0A1H9PEX5_9BACI|nr:dihydrolipoamide acetyltransferase family protein [Salisediminibacterium haloalkalitolerans]SER46465.1 2-oxoisovalerate dehydrogenase E2 component (dihydrolipoyl transacylase) [Salisediminibacterium haloalkalitolerans]